MILTTEMVSKSFKQNLKILKKGKEIICLRLLYRFLIINTAIAIAMIRAIVDAAK